MKKLIPLAILSLCLALGGCHRKPIVSGYQGTVPPAQTTTDVPVTPLVTPTPPVQTTPGVPTVTLPPNNNDVPIHGTIPPPSK